MATYDRRVRFGKERTRATFGYSRYPGQNGKAALSSFINDSGFGTWPPFRNWQELDEQHDDEFLDAIYLQFAIRKADGTEFGANEWPRSMEAGELFVVEVKPAGTTGLSFVFNALADPVRRNPVDTPTPNLPNSFYFVAHNYDNVDAPELLTGMADGPEARDWYTETTQLSIIQGTDDDPIFDVWARLIDQRQDESLQLASTGEVSAMNLVDAIVLRIRADDRVNLFSHVTFEGNEYNVFSVRPIGRDREIEVAARRTIAIPGAA